jgi:hypothetical protein
VARGAVSGAVTATAPTQRPLPGDQDFDDYLRACIDAGRITTTQAFEQYEEYKRVVRARAAT